MSADLAVGFPPVSGPAPRLLILGSMPGRASLQAAQYYAHPRNRFWTFMGELFGAGRELPYDARLARLTEAGVALWDVLATCERKGSLDADIVVATAAVNPIGEWLWATPTVTQVALNVAAAAQLFRRRVVLPDEVAARVVVRALPSTSPANASIPLATQRAAWAALGSPPPEAAPR